METDMRPTPIGRFCDTPSYEELRREVARLRLTDEEREAIREACDEGRWYLKDYRHIDTLRGLLERTKCS
jgi:hypothetical protein